MNTVIKDVISILLKVDEAQPITYVSIGPVKGIFVRSSVFQYGLSIEVMHSKQLHSCSEAEMVQLFGHFEVLLEVIFGEGVEDTPIHHIGQKGL